MSSRDIWTGLMRVWLVYVTEETQLQRLMGRKRPNGFQARDRLAAQMPLDEKALVDLVIDNNNQRDPLSGYRSRLNK